MKPHIKKVNGEWVVANIDVGVLRSKFSRRFSESLIYCSYMNAKRRHTFINPYLVEALCEVVKAEESTPEELYIWDQRQFDRAVH